MGKLDTQERDRLKGDDFALPDRRYPIETAAHARAALARVDEFGSEEEKDKVREAVHRKYPGIVEEHAKGQEMKRRRKEDAVERRKKGIL